MIESRSLRVLIAEDEPLAVERLQILCAQHGSLTLVGTASEGEAAMRMVEALAPDLILLDIQMPGMDGMAVARAVAVLPRPPAVIFVTAYDQFAVAAFDVAAVDYLLKPIAPERLKRAIERVATGLGGAAKPPNPPPPWLQEFWIPHRSEVVRIATRDIDLIEAERDYMRIHADSRSYLLHETITELERKLDPDEFIRLHRSTIARRDRIVGFSHASSGLWQAKLRDGRTIRVGRTYLPKARAMLRQ